MTLSPEEFSSLPSGWSGDASGISREFSCSSYAAGVAFALRVALLAEKRDHHPDALTIAWKKVRVTFVTHSAGGVTNLDVRAALEVNALFDE
ncbi:4a-hydroxytetrahydrobiopterin dehydratase [Deinococcus yavapaiensis]|uniref:4a-hydroxytetrahydrobiopterin dehydratase n=1 Tax=Deinococcus yavapaiensis KR-236 TaxID=694435 RepID=A0A318S5R3_9DEIO|nr:4a-hydroxytetrahydrobiopterin dehydratase [Deinococcus yavapaiensis]PYE53050.1 4a-hydroxytetrahydrobiopterin dehydratase [Deinococcus yavapaiensis KR-236]